MATEIAVSYSSYRPWENGRDDHAGPTRLQAEQLDRALRRLLRSRYMEGEAFDVWGWPRQQDMTYDQVVELLRLAGFDVPRLQANGRPPAAVITALHRGTVHDLGKRRIVTGRNRHRDRKTKTRAAFPAAGRGVATRTAAAQVSICAPVAA